MRDCRRRSERTARRSFSSFALAALLLPAGTAAKAGGPEGKALVPLSVNTEDKGTVMTILGDDDVLASVADLLAAGIVRIEGTVEEVRGERFVSLRSLAPGILYQLDRDGLRVELTVHPEFLSGQVESQFGSRAPEGIVYTRDPSAFLNYSVSIDDRRTLTGFGEAGWSLGRSLLYSGITKTGDGWVRGQTNLTVDDRAKLVRWVAGDSFAQGGDLAGGLFLAGLSVSRSYALDPYFTRYPGLDVAGAVATPTRADVYVNGSLVKQLQLAPGTFDLKGIPLQSGSGETRVVLRDAFGQESVISSPFYLSTQVLAKGLSDYAYNLGFRRDRTGTSSFDYGGPVFVGAHRLGLTDSLTVGLRAEAAKGVVSGGGLLAATSSVGQVEVVGAASQAEGLPGWAGRISYAFQSRRYGVSAFVRRTADHYATVSLPSSADRATLEVGGSASVSFWRTGLGVDYARRTYRDTGSSERYGGSVRTAAGNSLNLSLSAGRVRGADGKAGLEGYLSLTWFPGSSITATATARRDGAGTGVSLDLQKALPVGVGYGYRASASTGEGPGNVAVAGSYQGTVGRADAAYSRIGGESSGLATVSGGLVAIGGTVLATRAVRDGFALIRVPGVEGVGGSVNNQEIGRTGRSGDLLVSDLLPYYGNAIGINELDVPLDHVVESSRRLVAPPYRGGAVVTFPVRRFQAFSGSVVLALPEGDVIPEYGSLTLTADGKEMETTLNRRGAFYLENVPAGTHPVSVGYLGIVCRTALAVAASGETQVKLGTLRCVSGGTLPEGARAQPAAPASK